MFDVYQNFSDLYDELVNHEDYESNLYKFLSSKIQWENKVVGEFGIGTGRVTKNYIDKAQKLYAYDNSQHMIDKAKENLSKWADKIEYEVLDNSKINSIENTFDVIIEGWSFGHLVVQDDVNRNQTIYINDPSNIVTEFSYEELNKRWNAWLYRPRFHSEQSGFILIKE